MRKYSDSYLNMLEGSGVDFRNDENISEDEANKIKNNLTESSPFILEDGTMDLNTLIEREEEGKSKKSDEKTQQNGEITNKEEEENNEEEQTEQDREEEREKATRQSNDRSERGKEQTLPKTFIPEATDKATVEIKLSASLRDLSLAFDSDDSDTPSAHLLPPPIEPIIMLQSSHPSSDDDDRPPIPHHLSFADSSPIESDSSFADSTPIDTSSIDSSLVDSSSPIDSSLADGSISSIDSSLVDGSPSQGREEGSEKAVVVNVKVKRKSGKKVPTMREIGSASTPFKRRASATLRNLISTHSNNNNNNNISNNNINKRSVGEKEDEMESIFREVKLELPDLSPLAPPSPSPSPSPSHSPHPSPVTSPILSPLPSPNPNFKSKYVNNLLNNQANLPPPHYHLNNNFSLHLNHNMNNNNSIMLGGMISPRHQSSSQNEVVTYLFKGWMYWRDNLFIPTRSNISPSDFSPSSSDPSNLSNQPLIDHSNSNNNSNSNSNFNGYEKHFIVITKHFIYFLSKNVEALDEAGKKFITKSINLTKYYFKEVFTSFELFSPKFNEFYIFQPENLVDYRRWIDAFCLTICKIISKPKNMLTGWMMKGKIKYGKPRFWKKRWFILEFGSLSLRYFTKIPQAWLDNRDLKGKIILVDTVISDLPNSMIGNHTGFGVLLKSNAASWCLSFDTLQSKEKFKSCVRKVIESSVNLLQLSNFRKWVYYSPPLLPDQKKHKNKHKNNKNNNDNNNNTNDGQTMGGINNNNINNNNNNNNIENSKALVMLTHYALVFFKAADAAHANNPYIIPDLSTVIDTICIIGGDVYRTSSAESGKHRFCVKDFAKFSYFISCDTSAEVKEWIEVLRHCIVSHANQNLGYNCHRISKFLRNVIDLNSPDYLRIVNSNNNKKKNVKVDQPHREDKVDDNINGKMITKMPSVGEIDAAVVKKKINKHSEPSLPLLDNTTHINIKNINNTNNNIGNNSNSNKESKEMILPDGNIYNIQVANIMKTSLKHLPKLHNNNNTANTTDCEMKIDINNNINNINNNNNFNNNNNNINNINNNNNNENNDNNNNKIIIMENKGFKQTKPNQRNSRKEEDAKVERRASFLANSRPESVCIQKETSIPPSLPRQRSSTVVIGVKRG